MISRIKERAQRTTKKNEQIWNAVLQNCQPTPTVPKANKCPSTETVSLTFTITHIITENILFYMEWNYCWGKNEITACIAKRISSHPDKSTKITILYHLASRQNCNPFEGTVKGNKRVSIRGAYPYWVWNCIQIYHW